MDKGTFGLSGSNANKTGIIKKKGLNSNQIKLIAILAMTIDHVTWLLFPGYQTIWWVILLHVVGRLTAPIIRKGKLQIILAKNRLPKYSNRSRLLRSYRL